MVTHQLQVKLRTRKVCWPKTNVLPLCRATTQGGVTKLYVDAVFALDETSCVLTFVVAALIHATYNDLQQALV